jgi:hypothetical protein
MKNILAENMLRFGVKNLKESDVKRIEESLLTEAEIDLKSMPEVKAAAAYFKKAWISRIPKPNYVLGEYYLQSTQAAANFERDYRYAGRVVGFKSANFGGVIIPIPDLTGVGRWVFEGEVAAFENGRPFTFSTLYWNTAPVQVEAAISDKDAAAAINEMFNKIPLRDLQTMYNVSKLKPIFDKQIATFKNAAVAKSTAIRFAKRLAPLLSGSAKAFYGV